MVAADDQPNKVERRFKRVPLVGTAYISFLGDERVRQAMIENVNRTGIGLFSKDPLPLQKAVRLGIEFTSLDGRKKVREELRGTIVQVTPWNKVYIIGVEFNDIVTISNHPQLFTLIINQEEAV